MPTLLLRHCIQYNIIAPSFNTGNLLRTILCSFLPVFQQPVPQHWLIVVFVLLVSCWLHMFIVDVRQPGDCRFCCFVLSLCCAGWFYCCFDWHRVIVVFVCQLRTYRLCYFFVFFFPLFAAASTSWFFSSCKFWIAPLLYELEYSLCCLLHFVM